MPKGEYTVVVRGETFILGREQILYDSPNYFSTCFLTPSSKQNKVRDATGPGGGLLSPVPEVPEDGDDESGDEEEYELVLHRDPYLFKLIEAYLSGYPILPLPEEWLPKYMSPEAAIKALMVDARYYELARLVDILRAHLKTMAPKVYRLYTRSMDNREVTPWKELDITQEGAKMYLEWLKDSSSAYPMPYHELVQSPYWKMLACYRVSVPTLTGAARLVEYVILQSQEGS